MGDSTLDSILVLKHFIRDQLLIELFCTVYELKLTDIRVDREEYRRESISEESTLPRLLYYFNDSFGGYSIQGITKSLEGQPLFKKVKIKRNKIR